MLARPIIVPSNRIDGHNRRFLNTATTVLNIQQSILGYPGRPLVFASNQKKVVMLNQSASRCYRTRRNSSSQAPPNALNQPAINGVGVRKATTPPTVASVAVKGNSRRGGCSLDRQNNNGHSSNNSNQCYINSAGRRETRMLIQGSDGPSSSCSPPSSSSTNPNSNSSTHSNANLNEKIIVSSDFVRKLTNRSAFYKLYEIGGLIGQGNFSEVFMVYSENSGKKYAVKEIDKNRMNGKLYFVENEIAILKQCNHHRNICRLVDAYECSSLYFLVFEYAHKGDLFETIKRLGRLSERSSAQITHQVASALHYLHNRKIVHRDVKPENILLTADFCVKLTDFGLACTVMGPLYRVCGTPTYVAPEVLSQQGYGLEVDVWSLGVLLYIMLIGFAPFRCADRVQLFKLIVKANVTFEMPGWSKISARAKQLILKMLTANTDSRFKALEVMNNEWIRLFNNGNVDSESRIN